MKLALPPASDVPARAAFDENVTDCTHSQNGIPAFFVFNALSPIASNATDRRTPSALGIQDKGNGFERKAGQRTDAPPHCSSSMTYGQPLSCASNELTRL